MMKVILEPDSKSNDMIRMIDSAGDLWGVIHVDCFYDATSEEIKK